MIDTTTFIIIAALGLTSPFWVFVLARFGAMGFYFGKRKFDNLNTHKKGQHSNGKKPTREA